MSNLTVCQSRNCRLEILILILQSSVLGPSHRKRFGLDRLTFCEDTLPLVSVLLTRCHHPDPGMEMLLVVATKELAKVCPCRLQGKKDPWVRRCALDRGKEQFHIDIVIGGVRPGKQLTNPKFLKELSRRSRAHGCPTIREGLGGLSLPWGPQRAEPDPKQPGPTPSRREH